MIKYFCDRCDTQVDASDKLLIIQPLQSHFYSICSGCLQKYKDNIKSFMTKKAKG